MMFKSLHNNIKKQRDFIHKISFILFFIFGIFITSSELHAACGGTTRTWQGTSTTWNTTTNWSGTNVPDTASEDVVMISTGFNAAFATNYSLGCVTVSSGTINGAAANITMTITGDYLSAPYQNSLNFTSNTFMVDMAGTAAQSFEAVDDVRDLRISNTTSVTLKNNFRILSDFFLVGSGTTIVEGYLQVTNAITIPSGHTVIIKNGGILSSAANLTVNGSLRVEGGGELRMANGRTLSVAATGSLSIEGSSGNPATVSSANASSTFTFNVLGSVRANYAIIRRTAATGMNVTGTIFQLDNTDFRAMVNTGYGLTLGAAAVVPATLTGIGFYNDDAVATPRNINANLYNLSAITLNSTSGDVVGAAFELDPNAKINWGTSAATELTISNDAETNEPTATLAVSTAVTFAEFAFTLNQSATATDITQVILTMTGTAQTSDLASVQAFRDVNGNCDYDVGTDTQIGSNLSFSGSPLKATITIPSGQLTTNSPSQQACLLIRATSSANPVDQRTVKFSIVSSSDVTNSQNYALSSVSGTPISTGSSILVNTAYSRWVGTTTTAWNTAGNWSPATLPSATRDCIIGIGTRTTVVNANPVRCANATLQSGGTLDFNSTANIFEVYNSINVSSGFNFLNATSGGITIRGTVNQTMGFQTAFPGNIIINNTGAAGSKTVTLSNSSTINGNLTCTAGILSIPNGYTLTVLGTITIQTGCTIAVEAGGTLALADGRTLTVNLGGTLQVVGSAGTKAIVTSNSGSAAYNVIVNGTISARYYTFSNLNTGGVSIEAGATIDTSNYLQDGTFSYPVNSNTTFLKLKRQIPGNALSNMVFEKNSSPATNIVNIDSTGASAGNLAVSSYSGDLSGESFDTDPSYLVDWSGTLNTIAITQEATSPATAIAGVTYNMGRFGFKQVDPGGAYSDTNITKLVFTLTGTGTSTDIDAVRLYRDTSCTGSGGTLIGTGTFSGNPAKVTFNITSGDLVALADLVSTVKVCTYVEFDIAPAATNGNTVGIKLNASTDFVNSMLYTVSSSTPLPVTLGSPSTISTPTTTTWTGTTSTDWNVSTNWTAGVPNSNVHCSIPNTANDPIISTGTGSCKNFTITNGILAVNAGAFLDVYGDFTKTAGTLTLTGTLSIKDGGNDIDQNIFSNSTLANLTLAKTGTGTVTVNQSSLTITTLTFSSATTTLEIPNGNKLVLPNNVTIGSGKLKIAAGGTLEMGNARTITVSGGTFQIAGTNDGFPQNIATKGIVQVTGAGANTYNFTATSGTVDLVGFQFSRLGVNGLNIGGTTTVANLSGGQLTNLSTTYASVKAIQLNTSGTIPATATNIAWTWGDFNVFTGANPTSAQAYKLVSSTGCGNQTIDFTGWTGDWYEAQPTFNVMTKISATNCTVNMGGSASAVSILSFMAVPFNNAVDLRWITNAERNHLGFNVYRADLFSAQFQQINKTLIRNLKGSGNNQSSYRFIDQDVSNDKIYYYYIEDVDVSGKKVLHGPVSATPRFSLGVPPPDNANENTETNPDLPGSGGENTPAPIPNPSYEDLGNGVIIIAKTSKSLRLEITPANPIFTPSAWNNDFEDVSIAGYSKMTSAGNPELPEKDILIEVQSFATTALVNNAKITENVLANHYISPAPDYSLNGNGILAPRYSPNEARYNSANNYPASFYSIQQDLIHTNKKKFLKLKINPLKFSPLNKKVTMATKIILDIGLDGDDWDVDPPDADSKIGVYAVANTLKIDYEKEGIYQLTYADLVSSAVEGPFENTATSQWRLYYKNIEIPLEIHSANGQFESGDYIRFYLPYSKEVETKRNQVILSPINITEEQSSPLRIGSFDANPTDETMADEVLLKFNKTFEQNKKFIDGVTLNDSLDHFFYADLVNFAGMDTLRIVTALPELDVNNNENVVVKYHVRGRLGMSGLKVKHNVKFLLGGVVEGEETFEENERMTLTFEVPANRFVTGNNTLDLKVTGAFAPATDYDFVLVDKVEIEYNGFKSQAGVSNFTIADSGRVHRLSAIPTNQITGYDITNPHEPLKLTNLNIIPNLNSSSFDALFYVDGDLDAENKKHYSFVTSNSFLLPKAMSLNQGVEESLKDINNRADLIIYGDESLLAVAGDLIDRRISQGLEVKAITPTQVYSEFSYGLKKSHGLRDFIQFALNSWEKPPRYLLILGDATYDPQDFNIAGLTADKRAALERATLPAPLIPGRFIDFSSDNFYVSSDQSHMPKLSVGRLPTNDPEKIKDYIEKLARYEDGEVSPDDLIKKITFFADQDTGDYERFNELSQLMMSSVDGFATSLYDRTVLGSKAITKAKIKEEFQEAPFIISLLGHGAFDRFGDDIFNAQDASGLTNTHLPIVANWNCESAYFYDADKTYKSLGEELIFNPDGGAIVYLGSTTQTTPTAQTRLAQNFFSQVSQNIKAPWDGVRLGDILYQAKLSVGPGAYEKDIINSFSIIGDPSLKLPDSLFPANPEALTSKSSIFKSKAGSGCSAFAGEGESPIPWYYGLLEWLVYVSLMILSARKVAKFCKI